MAKKNQEKSKVTPKAPDHTKIDMVFGKQNYLLAGLAFAVVFIGFLLMYTSKENVYNTRSITVAPIVVLCGFVIGVVAIMYKSKPDSGNGTD